MSVPPLDQQSAGAFRPLNFVRRQATADSTPSARQSTGIFPVECNGIGAASGRRDRARSPPGRHGSESIRHDFVCSRNHRRTSAVSVIDSRKQFRPTSSHRGLGGHMVVRPARRSSDVGLSSFVLRCSSQSMTQSGVSRSSADAADREVVRRVPPTR